MKSKIAEKCSPLPEKFDWIYGLEELRDEYTSVELQEKVVRMEGRVCATQTSQEIEKPTQKRNVK